MTVIGRPGQVLSLEALDRVDADDDGTYSVSGLPARPLRLEVRAEGYRTQRAQVDEDETTLDVTLQKLDKATAARKTALRQRMQALMLSAGTADEAQKAALEAEMQEIVKELQALDADR